MAKLWRYEIIARSMDNKCIKHPNFLDNIWVSKIELVNKDLCKETETEKLSECYKLVNLKCLSLKNNWISSYANSEKYCYAKLKIIKYIN